MQGDFDASRFRDRQHPLHEIDVIGEDLVCRIDAILGFWHGLDADGQLAIERALHVKSRHNDAAAALGWGRAPDQVGHPVQPQDGDARLAHIAHDALIILDLRFAARAIEHGVDIKFARHILDRFQPQPIIIDPLFQALQIGRMPIAVLAGQEARALQRVELHAADAQLPGEGQVVVAGLMMLPQRHPHPVRHRRSSPRVAIRAYPL